MERMAPGAFAGTIADNRDRMRVTFSHGKDPSLGDKVLGIPSVLAEDGRGVRYEVPLSDTAYNRELAPELKAGAYRSSFRFHVTADDFARKVSKSADNPMGLPERTVRAVQMQEFGPVTYPAYPGRDRGDALANRSVPPLPAGCAGGHSATRGGVLGADRTLSVHVMGAVALLGISSLELARRIPQRPTIGCVTMIVAWRDPFCIVSDDLAILRHYGAALSRSTKDESPFSRSSRWTRGAGGMSWTR